jgi:hypothetical protein
MNFRNIFDSNLRQCSSVRDVSALAGCAQLHNVNYRVYDATTY